MGNWAQKLGINSRLGVSLLGFALVVVIIVIVALPRIERYFLIQAGNNQAATLRLAVESLRSTLQRYAPIPNLIAARPEIRALLAEPDNLLLVTNAERLLEETAIALRATGVYLETPSGKPIVVVPNNLNSDEAGDDISYRPYFSQAVAGGLGQYYALGTQSGERGFFYAAPVRDQNRITGVIAIKFAVEQFEAAWRDSRAEIIVRDANDIVFMSSRPEWNFRAMSSISVEKMRLIEAARQFPSDQLVQLPNTREQLTGKYQILQIDDDGKKQGFVSSTSLIARAGWRVTILTPTSDAFALARTTITIVLLVLILLALITALLLQRRARLAERIAAQEAAQEMLEHRVRERTTELNTSNTKLVVEIEERKAAEQQLRKTQTDLIQAGKLAALGQMSAALSHELNQPLAAVKAYSENALAFMGRDRGEDAAENVRQISALTDRMSSIAKHLRNFARRPQEQVKPVALYPILNDALEVMRPKLSASGTSVHFEPGGNLWVTGGQVRLQQVFVNLISNAIDAMADNGGGEISISVAEDDEDDEVHVGVRDRGAGLSDDAMKLLFDPFFTTKDPGKGLGLGLSISYNIVRDFGGNISAMNHPDGGAQFRVTLRAADAQVRTEPDAEAAE